MDVTAQGNSATKSISSSGMGQYTANPSMYGALFAGTVNTLQQVVNSYRVVSWGIKISNLQAELSATGRIIVAVIPCTDEIPGLAILSNNSFGTTDMCYNIVGQYRSAVTSSTLLNYPGAIELSVGDLLRGDLQISGTYVSPRYFDFKQSGDNSSYTATTFEADSILTNNTGGAVTSSHKDPIRCTGGCAIVVYGEGLPASTNCFQVESIYHLECSPNLPQGTYTPVPSVMPTSLIGTTEIVESALAATAGMRAFKWVQKGAAFLNSNTGKKLLTAASALIG